MRLRRQAQQTNRQRATRARYGAETPLQQCKRKLDLAGLTYADCRRWGRAQGYEVGTAGAPQLWLLSEYLQAMGA